MKAKQISLSGFRNIESATVSFSPDITFLLGNNAQGKTNILEALYLFARGKSFRGASDKEMTSFGKEGYTLYLTYEKEGHEEDLFVSSFGREKTRKKNGILLEKQSELVGNFRAVMFSPDDLQMVKGSPSERRHFLDVAISQCYPVYISVYAAYKKNLDERNALLKAMQKGFFYDADMLAVYSEKLSFYAAEIYLYRKRYIERLKETAKDVVKELSSGRESLSLFYRSDMDAFGDETEDKVLLTERYRQIFERSTERERAAGMTLFGIHRDELDIFLSGISAKDFGSQGQQRSAVLALKMAEGMVSGEITGERPVYLFDDVLSELDEGRRKFLLSGMKGCQFVVTGCEMSVLGEISDEVSIVSVSGGRFEQK